jgi:hypothetical protein
MEDPLQVSPTPEQDAIENIFLACYTFEMIVKITALGFILNEGAYLRDAWNILDFVIVMSAYLTIFQDINEIISNGGTKSQPTYDAGGAEAGLSLNSLRSFRVLRPLRAISSIKGLQMLVTAVMNSFGLLKDTILVLFAFFTVFSIACT